MTTPTLKLGVEAILLAAAVAAVAALSAIPGRGTSTGGIPVPAAVPGPPPPPPTGAFVLAQENGADGVALSGRVHGSKLELTGTVFDQTGFGVNGLTVSFAIDAGDGKTSTLESSPCGAGCYGGTADVRGRPAAVTVQIFGKKERSQVRFAMPDLWPPTPAGALVRRAAGTIEHLRTLVTNERLGSDAKHVLHTIYRDVAPNRLEYTVEGVGQSIIVGSRRWDRKPGGPWKSSPQQPITVPSPAWGASTKVTNAFLLGTALLAGRRSWVVSFATPTVPAWFTIWIDPRSLRTVELRMTAAAHFMHHVYSGFNQSLRIEAPDRK